MDWFRSHHGAPSDSKWLVIARKAKVQPVAVVAVFWSLLDYASQQESRGDVAGFDPESVAAFLGIEDDEIAAIMSAFEEKGITADGRVANWEKRQPKREREDNSAERVQRHRATKQASKDSVTPCNAMQRQETPRGEERREEEIRTVADATVAPAADPFMPQGTEHKPGKINLKAILADRPHWNAWLEENRPAPEQGKSTEGFDRWKVCQWLNGKEEAPPVPPPPPAEKPLPEVFRGCLGEGIGENTVRVYLRQAMARLAQDGIWDKEESLKNPEHCRMAIDLAQRDFRFSDPRAKQQAITHPATGAQLPQ